MLSVNEINLLQAQNEGLKKQNAELQKENAELKAENERLKKEIKQIGSDFIKKGDYSRELEKQLEFSRIHKSVIDAERIKYKQTLQEIKEIVCGNYEIIDPQGRKDILKLITKAESEVK